MSAEGSQAKLILDLLVALAWYGMLAMVNQTTTHPVISIFPYLIPIACLSWRYGLFWAFSFSAIATLAAVPAGYALKHPGHLYWAGFTTYLKLSCAAVGVQFVKTMSHVDRGA